MNKSGVLEEKFSSYYNDINIMNYRTIFAECINLYSGISFKKILDIGSGTGLFLEAVKPFNFQLYALEASKTGVSILQEKGINVTPFFLEKDMCLPYNNNSFSLVVMNQVIEHLDKKIGQFYISEIIRILEPGGVAIIKSPSYFSKIWRTDPHHKYCWKPYELLNEVKVHKKEISSIMIEEGVLEPWMLVNYNEKVIDTWHKYNKHPYLRKIFRIISKTIFKVTHSERFLGVANISFTKRINNE